jgi:hypothetical protein
MLVIFQGKKILTKEKRSDKDRLNIESLKERGIYAGKG